MAVRPNSARNRGYALVLVTLLTLVSSMAIAVILQRQAAVSRTVGRQLDRTRQRHVERGLRELLSGWLRTVRGESVAERLGPDGHALSIELPDGLVSVSMRDAQGPALAVFDAVPDQDAPLVLALYEALGKRVGPSDLERVTRLVGPPRVSVASADPQTLEAAAEAAVGPDQASAIGAAIREAVAQGPITDAALRNQVLEKAGLEPADRTEIMRLITAEPELWELDITVEDRLGRGAGRYRALVVIPRRQGGARQGSVMGFSPLGPFLVWERVGSEAGPEYDHGAAR